ncbi:hypothetical protein MRB53_041923 [Persea americana]|nr:hypothetical protein MRB53_041923 [Persea americana]
MALFRFRLRSRGSSLHRGLMGLIAHPSSHHGTRSSFLTLVAILPVATLLSAVFLYHLSVRFGSRLCVLAPLASLARSPLHAVPRSSPFGCACSDLAAAYARFAALHPPSLISCNSSSASELTSSSCDAPPPLLADSLVMCPGVLLPLIHGTVESPSPGVCGQPRGRYGG